MEPGPKADYIWNPMESPVVYIQGDSQGGQSVNVLLTSSTERNLGIGQTNQEIIPIHKCATHLFKIYLFITVFPLYQFGNMDGVKKLSNYRFF